MNEAVNLAKYFFLKTNRRATKATMGMTINQAKSLLEAGFSSDEIMQGVDHCIEHPPKKGFQSLGWLSWDLENILTKVKAQKEKQELIDNFVFNQPTIDLNLTNQYKEKKSEERVNKDFDFGMFEEKED